MPSSCFQIRTLCLGLTVLALASCTVEGRQTSDDHPPTLGGDFVPSPDDTGVTGQTQDTGSTGEDTGDTTPETGTTTTPNRPPSTPVLESPIDGSGEQPLMMPLCWMPSLDPDGDPIRYRVWVDEMELSNGVMGVDGFEGPCTEELNLIFDKAYSWRVAAFDPDEPSLQSEPSGDWEFRTVVDPNFRVLFADDFETDKPWIYTGDAVEGHWVRGKPTKVETEVGLGQPGECHNNTENCVFTGRNLDGLPDERDVDEGSVIMTSPPFDMRDVKGITVKLWRFFYRSDFKKTGGHLRVELLVPDADAAEGYTVHLLEKLDNEPEAQDANLWTPAAYSICDIPFVDGGRVRITATDVAEVILEAAIDDVVVQGHASADTCSTGEGALCDTKAANPCDEGLVCCATGDLNDGTFRCASPERSIGDEPPAGASDPLTGPLGCSGSDLYPTDTGIDATEDWEYIPPDDCTVFEGCVEAPGWRKLLKFNLTTQNVGSRDLVMGIPANHPELFEYSPCHGHYHFKGFARFELRDADGENVVATGHKQASCLVDNRSWAWDDTDDDGGPNYNCRNQGLTLGWQDVYRRTLDCQWVDVTDVAPGDYTLRMDINFIPEGAAVPILAERDYTNNRSEVPVTITDLPQFTD